MIHRVIDEINYAGMRGQNRTYLRRERAEKKFSIIRDNNRTYRVSPTVAGSTATRSIFVVYRITITTR